MNNDLLNAYRHELRFLREVGNEFSRAYPQYARALAADAEGAYDPVVERLLEAVAFLTAKTACRLDTEGERLAQDVLHATMPDLLCPLPPVSIVELQPLKSLSVTPVSSVPRGSTVCYQRAAGDATYFQTVSSVHLLPLKLRVLQAPDHKSVLRVISSPGMGELRKQLAACDVLRVELSTLGGQSLRSSINGRLRIYCAGNDGMCLWGALTQRAQSLLLLNSEGEEGPHLKIHKSPRLLACGWRDDEALLPETVALPGPYRLLREWAHFRQRFAFGELVDLPKSVDDFTGEKLELWWFLPQGTLPNSIPEDSLRLFCTPVINLERLRCDPVAISPHTSEYSIFPPAHRAEGYRIVGMDCLDYRGGDGRWKQLKPLHRLCRESEAGHYAVRVLPRWPVSSGRNTQLAEWEWLVSPTINAYDEHTGTAFIAATVWASRIEVGAGISTSLADDGKHWRLEYAAPVTGVRGVGLSVAGQTVPVATQELLRVAMMRFEHIAQLPPDEAGCSLQRWLSGIAPEFTLPDLRGLRVELSVRSVPFSPMPVVAQGYVLLCEMSSTQAMDGDLDGLLHVLAATLARQQGPHAFVTACALVDGRPLAESVVWR